MRLFDAIYYDNVDEVFECIFAEEDVNLANEVGNRPVHAAARTGNVKILDILRRAGADMNSRGVNGNTALHFAAVAKQNAAVAYLLDHGLDPTVRNGKRLTPADICEKQLEEVSSNNRRERGLLIEMKKCLDDWILQRVSFLRSHPSANEATKKTSTPSQIGSEELVGKMVLEAVAPLIEQEAVKKRDTSLLPSKRRTSSSAATAESEIEQHESISSPTSSVPLLSRISSINSDEQAIQGGDGGMTPVSRTPSSPSTSSPRAGFYIQVDGEQIFVSLDNEDDDAEASSQDFVVEITPQAGQSLGMELQESDLFTRISALQPEGTAEFAGLRVGDLVLEINEISQKGKLVSEVSEALVEARTQQVPITVKVKR